MNWEQLLSTSRYKQPEDFPHNEERSAFEQDYDRIVFSSAFRKLQDKTQVIPFPINDFVHSRLTHSLEVSCVGRSLGKLVGKTLVERHPELQLNQYNASAIGATIAAASLAHDIGNPPFGHSGENAFRSYFATGNGRYIKHQLTDVQWLDFERYEGNANGFRILTNLSQPGGLRLTHTTLAAFTKYPKNAVVVDAPKTHQKKFGFFQAESNYFKEVAESTGLQPDNCGWLRHPLAYLMEAADDVCYSIIDFEDGVRLGLIDIKDAYELFGQILGKQLNIDKLKTLPTKEEQAGLMRALTINKLTQEMADIFLDHETAMLKGDFEGSLVDQSVFLSTIKSIKNISIQRVYNSEKVLMSEAAGFEIIEGLLDIYVSAIMEPNSNFRANKIKDLIPQQHKPHTDDVYTKLLHICDYISGLSDSQALNLYRKLKGIEIAT